MRLRQTLGPQVLWDTLTDWCPACPCEKDVSWTEQGVVNALKIMDQFEKYYP